MKKGFGGYGGCNDITATIDAGRTLMDGTSQDQGQDDKKAHRGAKGDFDCGQSEWQREAEQGSMANNSATRVRLT